MPVKRGIPGGVIAVLSIAAIAVVICVVACVHFVFCRRKKVAEESSVPNVQMIESGHGVGTVEITSESAPLPASVSQKLKGITVAKSVEFTYEELAMATNNFDISYKIGQGGFGSVYYAELRGEKAAIKKMSMQASKEFLAELKVLTHVNHVNLVRLRGYCIKDFLFLVYEYIDNGNLRHHLHGRVTEPLSLSTRVQIALDSARGLEYIHDHTVPVYIHRDIKSANILIDKNFRAKVADFGLARLTEVGSASLSHVQGTFGYMAPEYAGSGDISPKIDVYAFGVILFELISAKEAVLKRGEVATEPKALVTLFQDAFSQPDQTEALQKLVDPSLGDDYPLNLVLKVAYLAKACTHENPQLRPSMRSIVVELMTLSSSPEDSYIGSFYGTYETIIDSYAIGSTNKVVKAGDCVLMRPSESNSAHYVARVEKIEADNRNNVRVQVRRYYRPEETVGGREQFHGAKELFLSDHYDIQSAHSIEEKCIVHTLENYTKLENVGSQDYCCRFEYKHVSGTFLPDRVPMYCKCKMPYNPDDLMMQCDECKDWYHPACLDVRIERARLLDHFNCSAHRCKEDVKKPHRTPLTKGKSFAFPSKRSASARRSPRRSNTMS
ncbi:Serine/threonine protein kinase [Handroanthus impetiginosus]|uniref:non-specific serine/threonine protein kinase n=1 Tax=Handroanthus impetiginosus TaxID=429701 RepID=A0A2G9FZU1_9LAMI|nr:Serine/threonine protein kinase [Handroanthus impetiginosus]